MTRPCANACGRQAAPRRSLCGTCRSANWRAANPQYHNGYAAKRAADNKLTVITLYGGACQCCGESNPVFMTMDHVDASTSGGRNRKQTSVQRWNEAKRRHGDGYYQLMCFNCNTGRHINGGICPHQERTRH